MISVRAGNGSPGPDQGSSKLQILPLSTARKQTGTQNADIASQNKNLPSTDCFKAQIAFLPLSLLLRGGNVGCSALKFGLFQTGCAQLAAGGQEWFAAHDSRRLSCLERFPKHHWLWPASPNQPQAYGCSISTCMSPLRPRGAPKSLLQRGPLKWVPR